MIYNVNVNTQHCWCIVSNTVHCIKHPIRSTQLSWLENAYSRQLFPRAILPHKMWSGWPRLRVWVQ